MSIKMVHQGKIPGEIIYEGTCLKCFSKYESKRSDLTYQSDYRESWYEHRYLLTDCGNNVYFNPKK